jgi:hypothetical protein
LSFGSTLEQTHGGHRRLKALSSFPLQTFYVPFKEEDLYKKMFLQVNNATAKAPLETIVSLACSTDNTVVWYDHWEDGYELDATNATSRTTEIWGDGNATNGCPPDVKPCTDASDRLNAGDSVVIQNTVVLPRNAKTILYDGGDRVQASFPVTMTRGAYPSSPGSLMAGATEMVDTQNWGMSFEAPIGQDIGLSYNSFEYCGLFFMAAFDETVVTLPNKTKITLNSGESSMVRVNQSQTLTSTDILQVHLITGDIMSYYELRWYSLFPIGDCK